MEDSRLTFLKKYTVVYAEDSQSTRGIYIDELHKLFDKTYIAYDGLQAWQLYQQECPDFILTDIEMPKLDGLMLVQRIRERNKEIPIIVMTSHSENEKLLQAIPLGLTAYLTKPVSIESLEAALLQAFRRLESTLESQNKIMIHSHLCWDIQNQRLFRKGNEVLLSKNELLVFKLLISQKYRTFTYDEIIDFLYDHGDEAEHTAEAVKSIIKRLRKKIDADIIENIYGLGYRLVI